jgi:hypothetical protein
MCKSKLNDSLVYIGANKTKVMETELVIKITEEIIREQV